MSANTKLSLSSFEWDILCNPEWIYAKNQIMQKGIELFAAVAEKQKNYVNAIPFINELGSPPPKISRGEQYKGLPYLMLDYPRIFTKDDVFAIRTMLWWGKYFSVTLHLKGAYFEMFRHALMNKSIDDFKTGDFYLQYGGANEWEHDLHAQEWTQKMLDQDYSGDRKLFKVALKIELTKWEKGEEVLYECFTRLVKLLQAD
jgi:hypothetical protein